MSDNPVTGWTQINTPFSGLFNDIIEIYGKIVNDKVILSDDGFVCHNLELFGFSVRHSEKIRKVVSEILLNYGVKLKHNELIVETTKNNFPQQQHNLISAISEIKTLFMFVNKFLS